MARKTRPSAEVIDRELRHKLVKIMLVKDKSAYHRELANLAEAFIDYIDVKNRVLPRDHPIDIKVKL